MYSAKSAENATKSAKKIRKSIHDFGKYAEQMQNVLKRILDNHPKLWKRVRGKIGHSSRLSKKIVRLKMISMNVRFRKTSDYFRI